MADPKVAAVEAERSRLIALSTGKTVEVRKWSFVMRNRATKLVTGLTEGASKKVDGKTTVEGEKLFQLLLSEDGSEKMLDLVRMSLSKEHVDVVHPEMDADDADKLIEATVALNGGALKKSLGLPNQFLRILAGLDQ